MDRPVGEVARARLRADLRASGLGAVDVLLDDADCGGAAGGRARPMVTVLVSGRPDEGRGIEPPRSLAGLLVVVVVVVVVAGLVQDVVVETYVQQGMSNWPVCPEHPHNYPMAPIESADGSAWWACPVTGSLHFEIARLVAR